MGCRGEGDVLIPQQSSSPKPAPTRLHFLMEVGRQLRFSRPDRARGSGCFPRVQLEASWVGLLKAGGPGLLPAPGSRHRSFG